MNRLAIERVTASRHEAGTRTYEISVKDRDGKTVTLSLTAEAAADLQCVLADLSGTQALPTAPDGMTTKLPADFAIGTARHQKLTLLRFEHDTPYGLTPEMARDVAEALMMEADEAEKECVAYRH